MNVTIEHIREAARDVGTFLDQRVVSSDDLMALDGFVDEHISIDRKPSVNFKDAMVISYALPGQEPILESSLEEWDCICMVVRANFVLGEYSRDGFDEDYCMVQSRIFSPGTIPVLRSALKSLQSII